MTTILKDLEQFSSKDRKRSNSWFFKTGEGDYGEGDKFIGVSNPDARKVAIKHQDLNFKEIKVSLSSEIHEERLVALFILVRKFEKSKDIEKKKEILDFYLENLGGVNNWDLVDSSCSQIIGYSIILGIIEENILDKFAESKNLWEKRIAIISTLSIIKNGRLDLTLKIAKKLLVDKHDLIHKAVGWALREVWKKDNDICEKFLKDNYNHLPRTTLRYAIEKMPEEKRKKFLKLS